MITVRDIVTGSLKLIEEVGEGQPASAEAIQDGLTLLTQMLDMWSVSGDMIFTESRESFPLTAGQVSYTWGTGGTWNSQRPYVIKDAFIVNAGNSTPVICQDWDQYALIPNKDQTGLPNYLYYDGNYPLANIRMWYVPAQAYTLWLYSHKPLTTYSDVNTTISVPPGWELAMIYNLAVLYAPQFGKEASATVKKTAIRSARIISTAVTENKQNLLRMDLGIQAMSVPSVYNIWTGR